MPRSSRMRFRLCRSKYPCICSYSHFCFLVNVLLFVILMSLALLATVISHCIVILIDLCSPKCRRMLPPLLDSYVLCMISLACKALILLSSGPFVTVLPLSVLGIVPRRLHGDGQGGLFLWCDFCCRVWFWEAFSFVWSFLFLFFLSSPLVWWCPLVIFSGTCNFPFFNRSNSFLIWQFYSFYYLSFPFFIMTIAHFIMLNSIPIIYLYILTVCISLEIFSFFFVNNLKSTIYMKWLIFFAI